MNRERFYNTIIVWALKRLTGDVRAGHHVSIAYVSKRLGIIANHRIEVTR